MGKEIIIPKLPYGQGSISLMPDGKTLIYKKSVKGIRKTVYGKSVKEVMSEMTKLEINIENQIYEEQKRKVQQTLYEAMMEWLYTYKKPKLKKTSFDTLEKTIRSRIGEYDIGSVRIDAVDSDMIQNHINSLNEEKMLSYSTIKKCYDALNDFYRHRYLRRMVNVNPMDIVEMINKENIIKETKEIHFFDEDDMNRFIGQATKLWNHIDKPMYQYGFCLCANFYLGMRAGELLALKWKDIDLEKNSIYVHENLQLVNNDKYDKNNKEEMERLGITKQIYITQSIKTYKSRYIPINKKAREYILLQKKYSEYTSPDDYFCCTRDGNHSAISYLSDNIREITRQAKTYERNSSTHVIRHTCASMYFRKGVKLELIASRLGHSVDVCRETYLHFVEEQKRSAVELISDFDV